MFTESRLVSEQPGRLGLVRGGHVRAREAERDEAAHGILDAAVLDQERHVGPVEPERGEGGVLHRGRERGLDRVADQADEPGRPAQQFVSPFRVYASNSSMLAVKKWLRQSGFRTK